MTLKHKRGLTGKSLHSIPAMSSHQRGMVWEAYLHSLLSDMFPADIFGQEPTYYNVAKHPIKHELVSEDESKNKLSRVE